MKITYIQIFERINLKWQTFFKSKTRFAPPYLRHWKKFKRDSEVKTNALQHFKVDPVLKSDTTFHCSLKLCALVCINKWKIAWSLLIDFIYKNKKHQTYFVTYGFAQWCIWIYFTCGMVVLSSAFFLWNRKELSLCHILKFSNPNIFATQCRRPLIFQTMNSVR